MIGASCSAPGFRLVSAPAIALLLIGTALRGAEDANAPADGAQAATAPALPQVLVGVTPEQTEQTRQRLLAIVDGDRLRLTSDANSTADAFTLQFRLKQRNGEKSLDVNAHVARDKNEFAMVIVGPDHLPYAYMRDKLLVVFDSANPGQLAVHEGGSATLLFRMGLGGPDGMLNYSSKGGKSKLDFDIKPILSGLAERMAAGRYQKAAGLIDAATPRGAHVTLIEGDADPATYPLQAMGIRGGNSLVGIGVIRLQPPNKPVVGRTLDEIKKLNLPIRYLADQELVDFVPSPPAEFCKNERERQASEKLRVFFGMQPAKPSE